MRGKHRDRSRRSVLKAGTYAAVLGVLDVSSVQADSGAGICVDQSDPNCYDSIQTAVDAAAPGATVNVRSGTYNQTVVIDKSLILSGHPGDETPGPGPNAPVLDGQNRGQTAIYIQKGVNDVTIEGLDIRNFGDESLRDIGRGIVSRPLSNNVDIRDNRIAHIAGTGLVSPPGPATPSMNWAVERNVVADCASLGIRLSNTASSIVRKNLVRGTSGHEIGNVLPEYSGAPIYVTSRRTRGTSELHVSDITVEDNTVRGPAAIEGIGVYSWDETAADTPVILSDVSIAGNDITASEERQPRVGVNMISLGGGQFTDITVSNNNVTKHRHNVLAGASIQAAKFDGVVYTDNTLTNGINGAATFNVYNGDIAYRQNEIRGNVVGMKLRAADSAEYVELHQNNIYENEDAGLVNTNSSEVKAQHNWWGAPNGPERQAGNSNRKVGDGNAVEGPVDFKPWLSQRA